MLAQGRSLACLEAPALTFHVLGSHRLRGAPSIDTMHLGCVALVIHATAVLLFPPPPWAPLPALKTRGAQTHRMRAKSSSVRIFCISIGSEGSNSGNSGPPPPAALQATSSFAAWAAASLRFRSARLPASGARRLAPAWQCPTTVPEVEALRPLVARAATAGAASLAPSTDGSAPHSRHAAVSSPPPPTHK